MAVAQVPDQELVERVTGRRLDPQTGLIYHLKFKPPPEEALERLIQRSDDTEAKLRNRLDTHHANVAEVLGYYKDITVEVLHPETSSPDPGAVVCSAHCVVCFRAGKHRPSHLFVPVVAPSQGCTLLAAVRGVGLPADHVQAQSSLRLLSEVWRLSK